MHPAGPHVDWITLSTKLTEVIRAAVPFTWSCWHPVDPGTVRFTRSLNNSIACSGRASFVLADTLRGVGRVPSASTAPIAPAGSTSRSGATAVLPAGRRPPGSLRADRRGHDRGVARRRSRRHGGAVPAVGLYHAGRGQPVRARRGRAREHAADGLLIAGARAVILNWTMDGDNDDAEMYGLLHHSVNGVD